MHGEATMKRFAYVPLAWLGLCMLQGNAAQVWAQNPYGGGWRPNARPTVSPYLNLLRGGSSALNYYNLVRPITTFQNSIQQLQQQANMDQQAISSLQSAPVQGPPPTGHPVGFQTHTRYFLTTAVQTGSGTAGPRQPGTGQARIGRGTSRMPLRPTMGPSTRSGG